MWYTQQISGGMCFRNLWASKYVDWQIIDSLYLT